MPPVCFWFHPSCRFLVCTLDKFWHCLVYNTFPAQSPKFHDSFNPSQAQYQSASQARGTPAFDASAGSVVILGCSLDATARRAGYIDAGSPKSKSNNHATGGFYILEQPRSTVFIRSLLLLIERAGTLRASLEDIMHIHCGESQRLGRRLIHFLKEMGAAG